MGLDNGFYVRSNKRKITRDILPAGIVYPFDTDYTDNGVEIIYHRKDWGWRTDIINTFGWRSMSENQYKFEMGPGQALRMIELTASWLDKERWENEGSSIWEYDEIKKILIRDISNLAIIYGFMLENPDVYLEFYDSY